MNSFREVLLKYGSFFLVFVVPFVYFGHRVYPHISSKTFFFYGVVEILTALWIYTLIIDTSYRLSKKTLLYIIPAGLFVVWMTLATFFAVNPILSFWSSFARGVGLLTILHAFVFMLITASLVKKYGIPYVYSLFQWIVNGGFILALSVWGGIAGFKLSWTPLKTDGGGGMTGNSSLAAAYFLFVLAFGIFLLVRKNVKKNKWWNIIVIATILSSPLFINIYSLFHGKSLLGDARGALLGILSGIGATCALYAMLSKNKVIRILGITLIVIGLTSFSYLWMRLITPGTVINQKFTEAASGTRFIFWDEASQAMQERPWFGYGPENYMIAFARYFNPKMTLAEYHFEGWTDRAHNMYYDLGVSGGYPAIIFFAAFLGMMVYAAYSLRNKGTISNLQISILVGVIIGYVVQNLFYFDSVLSYMVLFLLGGIIFTIDSFTDEKKKIRSSSLDEWSRNMIAGALAVIAIFGYIYLTYQPNNKAKALGVAFENKADKNYNNLLSGSSIGDQWDVSDRAHATYAEYARSPVELKANQVARINAQKNIAALLPYLEKIAQKNTTDYRLYMSLVHLYSTDIYLGNKPYDPVLARHLFELLDHAHTLSPTNPETYWGRSQIYAWEGNLDGVIEEYKKAIAIDPTISSSHKLLIQFLRAIGRPELYKEALEQAQKDIPGFTL